MTLISFFKLLLDTLFPPRSGKRVPPKGLAHIFSPECVDTLSSLFPYKHPMVKQLIWRLKYSGDQESARIFGEVLYSCILEDLSDTFLFKRFSEPIIIPLPASSERMRTRGFNQCKLLTDSLADFSHPSLHIAENILYKPHDTREQKSLSRSERAQNLLNSFAVSDPARVNGQDIILIDDVMTTGATLTEASRTLIRAGARTVLALALAH